MGPFRSIDSASRTILALMFIQFVLAAGFIVDFVIDVSGIRTSPQSYTAREVIEIAGWLALVLSLALNGYLFRSIMRLGARLEQTVRIASSAFADYLDAEFDTWGLSPSERDVALLAIKGFSNAEIAALLDKSEGTVKAQSNAVFRKAGVSGRVQLVTHFIEEFLDDSDGPLARVR